ncbi:MAG: hypothetical protein EPN64_04675 [Burkholderiaceae bacterium]|nr:MAG: hypothetical protein EPN64_04675 [Burkholderiaceae bacterium]
MNQWQSFAEDLRRIVSSMELAGAQGDLAQSPGEQAQTAILHAALSRARTIALIHSQYPITTDFDRGYDKGRKDAAHAIAQLRDLGREAVEHELASHAQQTAPTGAAARVEITDEDIDLIANDGHRNAAGAASTLPAYTTSPAPSRTM